MQPYLSFALLAYNERDCVREAALRSSRVLERCGHSYELVLVDDGSTDGTWEIMDELARELPRCRVIHHGQNLGVGAAIRTCYLSTQGEWATWFPADLQADPCELPRLLGALSDCDVLITYRDVTRRQEGRIRKVISSFDRTLVRWLFGLRLQDLHWIRFFRRSYLSRMKLLANSPAVDTEMVIQAQRLGARIREVPLADWPRRTGIAKAASWRNVARSVTDLMSLRLRGNQVGRVENKWLERAAG
jgi:glycosyltransferase involved in cell wall biosynthesis